MAYSEAEICNVALNVLGVRRITSLQQRSPEGVACNDVFYPVLDMMLSEFQWGFATQQHKLNQLNETPMFGWSYVYGQPNSTLFVQSVHSEDKNLFHEGLPFEKGIEGRIYTDVQNAYALCTMAVRDTGLFPAYFIDAFAGRLAVHLSGTLQNVANRRESAADYYNAAAQQAMLMDAAQGKPRKERNALLDSRTGLEFDDAGRLVDRGY